MQSGEPCAGAARGSSAGARPGRCRPQVVVPARHRRCGAGASSPAGSGTGLGAMPGALRWCCVRRCPVGHRRAGGAAPVVPRPAAPRPVAPRSAGGAVPGSALSGSGTPGGAASGSTASGSATSGGAVRGSAGWIGCPGRGCRREPSAGAVAAPWPSPWGVPVALGLGRMPRPRTGPARSGLSPRRGVPALVCSWSCARCRGDRGPDDVPVPARLLRGATRGGGYGPVCRSSRAGRSAFLSLVPRVELDGPVREVAVGTGARGRRARCGRCAVADRAPRTGAASSPDRAGLTRSRRW
ncbi:hypothetical protein SAMN05216207_1005199 [Pseudonocardia ammonioxydans]|uniref:Uncharacterized protein n=1 Tax=Pseudonocardia ammonioxydans TaxID=260086 RepID=A0A1I4V677_PSUAM|nr:hypothetical protein SAMN05216207_1005199 [Pseudonocardia ammonioxydans]